MADIDLKQSVYTVFSDKVMLVLALIALPIVVTEFIALPPDESAILTDIDWLIWFVFVLEFVLKIYVEGSARKYITSNKLDSVVSGIIILSAPAALFLSFVPFPVFGVVRAFRVLRAVTYADKVYLEKDKPKLTKADMIRKEEEDRWKLN